MPQPQEVTDAADKSVALWRDAEAQLRQRLAQIADKRGDEAAHLRAMLTEVDAAIKALEAKIPGDIEDRLSAVYAKGAQDTGLPEIFTQVNRVAVQAMAQQNYDELLAATRHVRTSTKTALRSLAKEGALRSLTSGDTASRAASEMTATAQSAAGRVLTVTYKNGAEHSLGDWADTAIRTQTASAYNGGALDQFDQFGIEWVEIADGPACGLTSHDDPEIANGLVVPLAQAREFPLAHPRCARSLLPRPDIDDKAGAKDHNDARDMDELNRQKLEERQRAARSTVTGRSFKLSAASR